MHISIFSQHNYIYFLLCVLQHYMFRPSVWAIIRCVWRLSHTIAWRRGDGVCWRGDISLCGFTYYVMHYVILVLILLMITVARGVPCFYLYDKTAYSRNISTILGRPCLYRSALYWNWYHCAYACVLVQGCGVNSLALWNNTGVRCLNELSAILWRQRFCIIPHNVNDTAQNRAKNPWNNSTNKSQAPEDGCINIRNMLSIK